jgi:DNA-binding protein HU-beta
MTKAELIERIARNRALPPDITKKCIAQILDVAFAELTGYFVRGKITRVTAPRFTFPGFGTFTKKRRNARRGVNPRTLEPMEIEASATVDFRPAAAFREKLNDPTARARRPEPAPAPELAEEPAAARRRRPLRSREEVELDGLGDLPETPLRRAGRSRRAFGRAG